VLTDIAATGEVPLSPTIRRRGTTTPWMKLARHLFVTGFDLGPLVDIGVGISGRNPETLKDLTV